MQPDMIGCHFYHKTFLRGLCTDYYNYYIQYNVYVALLQIIHTMILLMISVLALKKENLEKNT